MEFSVNSPIIFARVGVLILAVLAQSIYFLRKALRRGRELGMDPAKLKKTMTTAAVFTIAPAVAIIFQSGSPKIQFIIYASVGASVYMFSVIVQNQNEQYDMPAPRPARTCATSSRSS